jgi:inner membrane transporter RhtA
VRTALVNPGILAMGAAVAVLSSALPYTLELLALRRMPTTTFAVLMSLGPAVAALAGYVVLRQRLVPLEGLAIALVVAANIGAARD